MNSPQSSMSPIVPTPKGLLLFICFFSIGLLSQLQKVNAQVPFVLNAGTYVPFYKELQVDNSGTQQTFALNPYISAQTMISLGSEQFFKPEFGYVYFNDYGEEVRRQIFLLRYDFAWNFDTDFFLRYGISTHWYHIEGEGGTKSVRNGDSYSTFRIPSSTATSIYSTVDLGIDYQLKSQSVHSIRFDLMFTDLLDSERRMIHYLFTLGFIF